MKFKTFLLSILALAVVSTATSPHVTSVPVSAPVVTMAVERPVHLPQADRDFARPALRGLMGAVGAASVIPAVVPSVVPHGLPPQLTKRPTVVVVPVSTPAPKRSTPAVLPKPTQSALVWEAKIGWCESRDNYTDLNHGSGASGRYQFLRTTWNSNVKQFFASKYLGRAMDYPPAVQDAVFVKVFETQGTRPWAASRSCWEHR